MNIIIKRIGVSILKLFAINIPIYNEMFAKFFGIFGNLVGLSSIRTESVLRGMYLSKLTGGNNIFVGRYVLLIDGKGKINLGEGVTINHFCLLTADRINGYIDIGHHSHLDAYSTIHGQGGVRIGAKCAISSGVLIYSQSNQYKHAPADDIVDQPIAFNEVIIEDNVWIGANATILPGVTIHRGAIIGAGALVNKDVPANSIAVGVPIRLINKTVKDTNAAL